MTRLTAALLAAGLLGCAGDRATGVVNPAVGVYSLQTVNGAPPPVIILQTQLPRVTRMLSNAILTLNTDLSYSDLVVYATVDGPDKGGITMASTGTYSVSADTLRLLDKDGVSRMRLVLIGKSFHRTIDGYPCVYARP